MRVIVNEENSGSTFRQWLKGLDLATGDLVWLAESDDSCHPRFLERMVPEFYDPDVVLAYCQSALIGPAGQKLEDHFLAHTDDLSTARWRSRYCVAGSLEVEMAASQKNTIPNASAVLFRRPEHIDFADELVRLKFAGDWLFYAMMMRDGKVAYVPEVLNHYRRHEQTVSHQAIRGESYLEETLQVKSRVFETFPVSCRAISRSLMQTVCESRWLHQQLGAKFACSSDKWLSNPSLSKIRSRP